MKFTQWFHKNFLKIMAGALGLVLFFSIIPAGRDWNAFRLLAIVAILIGIANHFDKTPAKWFTPANMVKGLGILAAIIVVMHMLLPETGKVLADTAKGLDHAIATANLPKLGKNTTAATSPKPAAIRTKRIPTNESWGEEVSVPEGWTFRVRDENGNPIAVKFWDGRIISDENPSGGDTLKLWEGVVRNCNFRVRRISGEGFAIVTLNPPA